MLLDTDLIQGISPSILGKSRDATCLEHISADAEFSIQVINLRKWEREGRAIWYSVSAVDVKPSFRSFSLLSAPYHPAPIFASAVAHVSTRSLS